MTDGQIVGPQHLEVEAGDVVVHLDAAEEWRLRANGAAQIRMGTVATTLRSVD